MRTAVHETATVHGPQGQTSRAQVAGQLLTRLLENHPGVDVASVWVIESGDEITVSALMPDPPGPPISMWSPEPWEL